MLRSANSTQTSFNYQTFRSLAMSDLVESMEPIVNDPGTRVEPEDLQGLATDFESFDEYHMVYAIELCADLMPDVFALPTAHCLKHHFQSVRLAAHRALSRLSPRAITDDLIKASEAAIAAGAPIEEVGDLPQILRRRRSTN